MTSTTELHHDPATNSPNDSFIQGVKDCVPTLLGYISIGLAFGVVGSASGLSVLEIALLTILIYAGSAQFIFCALLLTSSPASAIIVTIFVVNLRHLLMSLTLAPHFTRYSMLRNVGFGTLLTDETFGVAVTKQMQTGKLYGKWMDGLNLTAYIFWILSCVTGAFLGQWVANPEQWGLDFALVAMFVALLVLQLSSVGKSKIMHYIKLIGYMAVIMYGLSYIVPSHVAVLLATVIVATIGVVTDK
ncbi:branched-chain amino acid ABC transporter permease [Lysinibacillus fusiformis]|uniref:AzlC family ABC transporter permease n=1 Tax=Lysinibacillus fusiformis TaxID=28031 RepID=UPI0004D3E109|nr:MULTISPECIES: AzlC family ABC transporter permease [Lysinibacillus]KEK10138.1 branched-chain amino acid ABC transporter permease [Lysinibacillus sphaericus]MCE4046515.1 AzlC family ABC transporter permease [Lysinibacillus fusiformis]MCT6816170.1 AzlC family ABC transporter permease [Lysinibacillus fusiformis]MCT6928895.1 AzlC family ABC transporter permease [Lysinibacillus fusiformis]MCT6932993.1 AzlC family ABC transporter permease [Lysinibacillus fusiformis]